MSRESSFECASRDKDKQEGWDFTALKKMINSMHLPSSAVVLALGDTLECNPRCAARSYLYALAVSPKERKDTEVLVIRIVSLKSFLHL